jgi:class 3 adenylate cyclase
VFGTLSRLRSKTFGDGIMASFDDAPASVACARHRSLKHVGNRHRECPDVADFVEKGAGLEA